MKKLLLAIFLLISGFAKAQTESILQHLAIDPGSLSVAQQEKLQKLNSHNIYKAIYFVQAQNPE